MSKQKAIEEAAKHSRAEFKSTREWTANPGSSCMTQRVPTALLNRIHDLGEALK